MELGQVRRRPGRSNPRSGGASALAPGPLFFLNAVELVGSYSDLDRIDATTGFPDTGGMGNDAVGGGAGVSAPRFRAATFNGGPCIEYDINGWIQWTANALLTGLTEGEYMALQVNTEDTGSIRGYSWFNNANFPSFCPYSDGVIYEALGVSSRVTAGNPATSLTSPYVYNPSFKQGGDFIVNVGDEEVYNAAMGTLFSVAASDPRVGRNASTDYWRGSIAALVLWPYQLSATQRAASKAYLESLWGV